MKKKYLHGSEKSLELIVFGPGDLAGLFGLGGLGRDALELLEQVGLGPLLDNVLQVLILLEPAEGNL